jgi:hypothetical protein
MIEIQLDLQKYIVSEPIFKKKLTLSSKFCKEILYCV